MRTKCSVSQQIINLKSKNIKFNIINEQSAIQYLTHHTYYFKLKSFAKSFEYNEVKTPKERKLQYISDVLTDYQFSKELHIFSGSSWLSDLYNEILKT